MAKSKETNAPEDVVQHQNAQELDVTSIVPVHDAILPFPFEGVQWAYPNLGDNTETENAAMAEQFELTCRYLQGLSNLRACFTPGAPDIAAVKRHHNCYVQLMAFIDARTKTFQQERLDMEHITPNRRKFRVYPVRYFDQQNRFTRRWTELYLYALSAWAQMDEVNTYTNDYKKSSADMMKKLPREAYRLMAVELFLVDYETAAQPNFRLTQADIDAYNPVHIPEVEEIEHPYTAFFTEDRIRPITTVTVPLAPGVRPPNEGGGHSTVSPGEVHERRARETVV